MNVDQFKIDDWVEKMWKNSPVEHRDDFGADGEVNEWHIEDMMKKFKITDYKLASKMFEWGLKHVDKIVATKRATEIRNQFQGISNEKLKNQLRSEGYPSFTLEYASCMS